MLRFNSCYDIPLVLHKKQFLRLTQTISLPCKYNITTSTALVHILVYFANDLLVIPSLLWQQKEYSAYFLKQKGILTPNYTSPFKRPLKCLDMCFQISHPEGLLWDPCKVNPSSSKPKKGRQLSSEQKPQPHHCLRSWGPFLLVPQK